MLTYGTVCSGIEAPSVGFHGLAMSPLWFSEIEPFPRAVLQHRFPNVRLYDDFTALLRPENRPADVDVLVGGTPCQAFSVAGLRGGLTDPRGNLALAFVALVDVLRPRWVLWENVPGVLSSSGGRDFGAFLGALGHIGYGFAYRVLDAQYFGLAQRRKRVFVVASPGDWRGPAAVLLEPESVRWDSPPRRRSRAGVAGSVTARLGSCGADDNAGQARHIVAAGVSDGDDAGEPVAFREGPGFGEFQPGVGTLRSQRGSAGAGAETLLAYGGGNCSGPIDVATACLVHPARVDFDVETFAAPPMGVRRLTPTEMERLQGFPDGWTLVPYRNGVASDGPRAKALGNSMAVPVLRWIGERILAVGAL